MRGSSLCLCKYLRQDACAAFYILPLIFIPATFFSMADIKKPSGIYCQALS